MRLKPWPKKKTFQVEKENLEGYSETPEAQANRLAAEYPQRRAQIFQYPRERPSKIDL
jgi:hypothetical protein